MANIFTEKPPLTKEQEGARTADVTARFERVLKEAEARIDTAGANALRDAIARRKSRLRE